jgi:hypothetical protein
VRKLFAMLAIIALPLGANEVSVYSLQGGWLSTSTPIHNHGIHGEGQILAVLDTGIDPDNCYFAEADGSMPPVNTRIEQNNVDLTRRKIVAVDFLWSCDAHPGATGCDDPANPAAWDNQGHGTHAAAAIAADKGTPIVHDFEDALATGAKLIIQDAGYIGGDLCSQRPGIGCPVTLTPILDQAYRQGARIHSNSWGDRQGAPENGVTPTGNYSQSARDVDAFVYAHPDMLVVFNTGNFGGTSGLPPASSLSAPGCAKNTLQVGGTRGYSGGSDDTIASYTLIGPTRDGRIKPDLVGPADVIAADSDLNAMTHNCNYSDQAGTSWASPTVASAAALVRQYYTDGFYPSGIATSADRIAPSAALLKATLIASARQVPWRATPNSLVAASPVPSPEQGWGFPVLDDALYFPGDAAKLQVVDNLLGLANGQTSTLKLDVRAGTPLKAVLVWTDPPGIVRSTNDPTPELVNDLDLRVNGAPVVADHLNNVEVVSVASPSSATYTISVTASRIAQGPRQSYALVVTGDFAPVSLKRVHTARR